VKPAASATTADLVLQAVAWGGLGVAALYLIGRRSPVAQLLGWSVAAAWVFVTVGTTFGQQVLDGLDVLLGRLNAWIASLKGVAT
jgi:hypothetical protein